MKNIYIMLLFISFTKVSITQPYKWGPYQSFDCFKNIKFSLVNYGLHSKTDYLWGVKFSNNYNKNVQFEYEISVGGETYPKKVTKVLAPNEIWMDGEQLITALLFKNSSTKATVRIFNVCFNNGECYKTGYATCKNGQVSIPVTGTNANNSNSEGSNMGNSPNKSSPKDHSDEIHELSSQKAKLCSELQALNNPTVNIICAGDGFIMQNDEAWQLSKIASLKDDIQKLENNKLASNKQAAVQKAIEEKLQKETEAKQAQFTQSMGDGRQALGSDEYDNAIRHFTIASGYATNSGEINEARQAIMEAQKQKDDAARKVRIEAAKKIDKSEDETYATTSTALVGLMAVVTDHYTNKPTYFRFQAGFGAENLPFTVNIANTAQSQTTTSFHPTFRIGLRTGLFNNKGISLHLNPIAGFGLNALSQGVSGTHLSYGGFATLLLSPKSRSVIKLFAEGGYLKRSGTYTYDLDAATGGATATDKIEEGEYDYSFIRYGGGLQFHIINRQAARETYIKPGVFLEKMSFATNRAKPVMLFNLQINIASIIILDASYSKKYAIVGKLDYPNNFMKEDKDYWSFTFIRQGLFNKKISK